MARRPSLQGYDRSGADRLLWRQRRRAPPRGDALGPDPLLGRYKDRLLDHQRGSQVAMDYRPSARLAVNWPLRPPGFNLNPPRGALAARMSPPWTPLSI